MNIYFTRYSHIYIGKIINIGPPQKKRANFESGEKWSIAL